VDALVGGNSDLHEETADTYSVGFVWTPVLDSPLFQRLSLSADYYSIDIKDAIGTISAEDALQNCYSASANPTASTSNYYCSLFTRSAATGEVSSMSLVNLNLSEYRTKGVDFQVDWAFGLGAVGLDDKYGSLRVNVIGSWLDSFQIQSLPGEDFVELKGTIGNDQVSNTAVAHPEWKLSTSLTYTLGAVDLGVGWRHIDGMQDYADEDSATPNIDYFDLSGAWRVNDSYEIRGGVTNVTDKAPPYFSSYVQANTDPSTYDVLGRRFYVGVKARF
jgi:outer membrane receptor protein involved in Fe transport